MAEEAPTPEQEVQAAVTQLWDAAWAVVRAHREHGQVVHPEVFGEVAHRAVLAGDKAGVLLAQLLDTPPPKEERP